MAAGAHRVGIVTGASRGIGRAVAVALARQGVAVIGVARTPEALEGVASELREGDLQFTPFALELTAVGAARELAMFVDAHWGRLDVLVGNAAILGPLAPITDLKREDFERVLATNLTANLSLLAELDPLLLRSHAGRALFMTAGAPREPFPRVAAYAASKAGLEALVKTYALEREGSVVKVNLFNPGPVRTDMRAEAVPNDKPELLPAPEQLMDEVLAMLSPDYGLSGVVSDFPSRTLV